MAGAATPPLLRIGVLALLVLQNTSLRLVMKHARTVSPNFSATAAVFACEVLKFSVAVAVLARVRRSLITALVEVLNYRELIPMLVPAALYLLADRLHHVSTRRLDVAAFQVLSQSKVLTAALFGKVFRGRDYSSRQWFCLCCIAGGIAICQLADIGVDTVPMPDLLGVATVMTTSLLGAAAGTYIEATLQRGSGDGVLWKRAAQMAANGCLIAAGPASRSNLDGFVFSAWMVVALNAAGGLLVAAAMRYADNVLKTLAASLSIVVSTVAATVFLSAPAPSSRFMIGGLVVVGAIYAYGTAPKAVVVESSPAGKA
jgi:UDP-sugar transporter A1/2/3